MLLVILGAEATESEEHDEEDEEADDDGVGAKDVKGASLSSLLACGRSFSSVCAQSSAIVHSVCRVLHRERDRHCHVCILFLGRGRQGRGRRRR